MTSKLNKDVILVKDSIENIRIAQEEKIKCICVTTDNDFPDELLAIVEQIRQPPLRPTISLRRC